MEENELDSYIHEDVPVPEGDEAKSSHKNNMVMAKRIIVDSIKDHLIPQVSSLKTPKAMFDALTKLFEGKNINRKMTTEECEDSKCRDYPILLHKGFSDQGTIRSCR